MDLDEPFDTPAPDDPYAMFAHVVLIGFEKDPDPKERYPAVEALGGVVLNERQNVWAERPLWRRVALRALRPSSASSNPGRSARGPGPAYAWVR